MKQILAINPPITDFAAYDFWAYPAGFLQLLSYLKSLGFSIEYLDCLDRYHFLMAEIQKPKNKKFHTGPYYRQHIQKPIEYQDMDRPYSIYGLPQPQIEKYLKQIQPPDIILITSMMTYWYPGIQFITKILRQYFKNTPVILGGIYANLCYEHAQGLENIDLVVDWNHFDHFFNILRKGNYSDFLDSFNLLPPAYELYHNLPALSWFTSMGCPFQCAVCASNFLYPKYIAFDPVQKARQLLNIIKLKKTQDISFVDDALLLNFDQNLLPFLDTMNHYSTPDHQVRFHTPNGLHLKYLTNKVARYMKKSNFQTIRLSLESSLEKHQANMDSKTTNTDFENAVENLLSAGFQHHNLETYIMMGMPGQKIEEVVDSIIFVAKKNIKIVLAAYSPIPHTKMFDEYIHEPVDPLYHNNTFYYHYQPQELSIFKKLRNFVSMINRGIDQNMNIFADKELGKYIKILTSSGQ